MCSATSVRFIFALYLENTRRACQILWMLGFLRRMIWVFLLYVNHFNFFPGYLITNMHTKTSHLGEWFLNIQKDCTLQRDSLPLFPDESGFISCTSNEPHLNKHLHCGLSWKPHTVSTVHESLLCKALFSFCFLWLPPLHIKPIHTKHMMYSTKTAF